MRINPRFIVSTSKQEVVDWLADIIEDADGKYIKLYEPEIMEDE